MSKDLNLCQFIGRLGNDVEIKYTPNGSAVANLSLACGDDYKDKQGQKVEQTNWIRVVAFGNLAEIMGKYLVKGSQIHVSGKQVTRKWQDADGNDRYSTEIVANEMQMLGGKVVEAVSANKSEPSNYGKQTAKQTTPQPEGFDPEDFEDIPF